MLHHIYNAGNDWPHVSSSLFFPSQCDLSPGTMYRITPSMKSLFSEKGAVLIYRANLGFLELAWNSKSSASGGVPGLGA